MLAQRFQLPRAWRKSFAVALMLGLHLALQSFAASEALHHRLHENSHAPDHQCVIKLFANGQLFGGHVPAFDLCPSIVSFDLPQPPAVVLIETERLLPPGRAPPIFPA